MSEKEPRETRPGTVSMADEEAVKQLLVSTVFGLWDIVNNLTQTEAVESPALPGDDLRLRAGPAGVVRLRGGPSAWPPRWLTWVVISSRAAGRGLMQAANEGAASADSPERSRSVGIRVDLPFEQDVNPFVSRRSSTRRSSCGCTISF